MVSACKKLEATNNQTRISINRILSDFKPRFDENSEDTMKELTAELKKPRKDFRGVYIMIGLLFAMVLGIVIYHHQVVTPIYQEKAKIERFRKNYIWLNGYYKYMKKHNARTHKSYLDKNPIPAE